MLDLADFKSDQPIEHRPIFEPCFGDGDFLIPIVQRLIMRVKPMFGSLKQASQAIEHSILAVELHKETFESTKSKLDGVLGSNGFDTASRKKLLGDWLRTGDFLLEPIASTFAVIVGNPPYLRQERILAPLSRVDLLTQAYDSGHQR
jgi:hypothetical protein